jgi:membrane protease YdiL (CAAX protease family)
MDQFPQNTPEPPKKTLGDDYPITGKDVVIVVVTTLLILLGGFLVIGAIGSMELMSEGGDVDVETLDQWASGNFETLPMSLKVAAMITQLILIIPAWVFISRRKLSVVTYLRLRPVPMKLAFYALLIGFGVAVVGDEISRLVNYIIPFPEEMAYGIQRMMQMNSMLDFLTMGLTVAVIAPVVEEMLFRGFFQRFFEAKRGVTSGVMMASALFAVYHFNIYWLIPILLMATVMGAMAWRAESVIPTIVVHLTNNSLGLIAANVYPNGEPSWFVMGDHVHPFVLLIAIVLLVFGLRSFFRLSEDLGLGGHGPTGPVGKNLDSSF